MVQKLSKKETGEDGGRYKTETQCLQRLLADVIDKLKNSKSFAPLNKTSQVSEA